MESAHIPCPNALCTDGYEPVPGMLWDFKRVCRHCDGRGYLVGTAENRKHYYALKSLAEQLAFQSRLGKQFNPGFEHSGTVPISMMDGVSKEEAGR